MRPLTVHFLTSCLALNLSCLPGKLLAPFSLNKGQPLEWKIWKEEHPHIAELKKMLSAFLGFKKMVVRPRLMCPFAVAWTSTLARK